MRIVNLFRNILLMLFVISIAMATGSSCAKQDANTIKIVKPKGKKKPYNPKKDKGRKRTKKVKMNN